MSGTPIAVTADRVRSGGQQECGCHPPRCGGQGQRPGAAEGPVDWKARAGGAMAGVLGEPFTPGWDVSGVVAEVGFGVTTLKVGDQDSAAQVCWLRKFASSLSYRAGSAFQAPVWPAPGTVTRWIVSGQSRANRALVA